jgi:hypothetical protein
MKVLVTKKDDVLAFQLARELSEKFGCEHRVVGNGESMSPGSIKIVSMQRPANGIGGIYVGEEIIVALPASIGYDPSDKVVVIETGNSKPRKERRPHGEVLARLWEQLKSYPF